MPLRALCVCFGCLQALPRLLPADLTLTLTLTPCFLSLSSTAACTPLSGAVLQACLFDVRTQCSLAAAIGAQTSESSSTGVPGPPDECTFPEYVVDGAFDDAWNCVKPAVGKYTYAYFNFVEDDASSLDGFLYILNDWMFKDDGPVDVDCFNEFKAFTGNNAEIWTIRVYGDQSAEVILNGETVQPRSNVSDDSIACGAAGFGTSPNSEVPHSIFELKFPASKGTFKGRASATTRAYSRLSNIYIYISIKYMSMRAYLYFYLPVDVLVLFSPRSSDSATQGPWTFFRMRAFR